MARDVNTAISAGGAASDMAAWTRDWGRLLRSARQVAGLSLADLSERTGLSRGYLSKLESGQDGARNPSRATLVALARALPSFRALAYQLEPVDSMNTGVSLTLSEELPRFPYLLVGGHASPEAPPEGSVEQSSEAVTPIQLGWREFEALVALLALERAAAPFPMTARLIARAADRPVDMMRRTLDRLSHDGALLARAPRRPGAEQTYTRGPAFESRLGLSRLGDALVLAAALLAQVTTDRPSLRVRQPVSGNDSFS
jgi:transcriptional regulator with XRE-family HTH domain